MRCVRCAGEMQEREIVFSEYHLEDGLFVFDFSPRGVKSIGIERREKVESVSKRNFCKNFCWTGASVASTNSPAGRARRGSFSLSF